MKTLSLGINKVDIKYMFRNFGKIKDLKKKKKKKLKRNYRCSMLSMDIKV